MKQYEPIFSIGCMNPPQDRLRSKFGGLPWGLSRNHWPKGMSLLAQLVHEPPRIDLGGDYVLHLWHWSDPEQYEDPPDYRVDARHALLLPRSQLGRGLIPPPQGTRLFGEVWIEGWREFDDNMPDDWLPLFYSSKGFREASSREGGCIEYGQGLRTKFGGQPCWSVAGPDAIDRLPGRIPFLFQTDGWIRLPGPMPDYQKIGATRIEWDNQKQKILKPDRPNPAAPWALMEGIHKETIAIIADFASDGSAYVFLDRSTTPPTPRWTWSR
ncbi:MAG: hypothetical protein ACK5ZC_13050 [Pirellulaceae bacterium]|jgi:hypothetical protein